MDGSAGAVFFLAAVFRGVVFFLSVSDIGSPDLGVGSRVGVGFKGKIPRKPSRDHDVSYSGLIYLVGAIASLAAFATRNLTTVFALILIDSPV